MKVKRVSLPYFDEQRAQCANVLGRRRHVGTLVAAELLIDEAVVVADGAGVKLHGEAVFDAHAGHLGEHLGLEDVLLFGDGAAGEDALIEGLRSRGIESRRSGR